MRRDLRSVSCLEACQQLHKRPTTVQERALRAQRAARRRAPAGPVGTGESDDISEDDDASFHEEEEEDAEVLWDPRGQQRENSAWETAQRRADARRELWVRALPPSTFLPHPPLEQPVSLSPFP